MSKRPLSTIIDRLERIQFGVLPRNALNGKYPDIVDILQQDVVKCCDQAAMTLVDQPWLLMRPIVPMVF